MPSNEQQPSVRRHPLDFDALNKGDVIGVVRLKEIIGMGDCPDHLPAFVLRVLGLKTQIEKELADRGRPVTVRIERGAIHICTDEEASDYNALAFRQKMKGAARAHRRNRYVDQGELSEGTARSHRRTLEVQGRMLVAIRQTRKQFALETAERKTPARLTQENDGAEKPLKVEGS